MTDRDRQRDYARMNTAEKLDGLWKTGRSIDNMRDYPNKVKDLKGIAARIKRIERGEEKV